MPPLALIVVLISLCVFGLTRLVLACYAGFDLVPLALWPEVFVKGLWFDAAVISILVAWVLLYESVIPERWRASRIQQVLRGMWLWTVVSAVLVSAVAE